MVNYRSSRREQLAHVPSLTHTAHSRAHMHGHTLISTLVRTFINRWIHIPQTHTHAHPHARAQKTYARRQRQSAASVLPFWRVKANVSLRSTWLREISKR